MSNSVAFKHFVSKYPDWEKTYEVYQKDDAVYKRIICRWKESKALQHEYHACINTQTGDIYLDCRRRKILAKHLTLSFLRPLHTVIKTVWHASIIAPLAVEIYKVAKGKQTVKELGINTLKSLADIVRTPLYGIAITITHIAAVILGCASPNTLYKTREIAGKLERDLLRVERIFDGGMWVVAPCFSPMRSILTKKNGKLLEPTKKELKCKLRNFSESTITFLREERAFFNDCMRLFPDDKRYVSPAAPTKA
jgi:hypothetical protein